MVDASSPTRLDEAKQVLSDVLQEEKVMGKPLLILANKQDMNGAMSPEQIRDGLGIESLLGGDQHHNVRMVSVLSP